ncbi:hypothetical protein ACFE04_024013 [Oxalis oulophora]
MEGEAMEFENELKYFMKVWILAIISACYCYYIASKLPRGIPRLLSISPIITLFFYLPINIYNAHFSIIASFFLTWVANSKLLLFAFDKGPLYPLPPNLLHFIALACFPVRVKHTTPQPRQLDYNFSKARSVLDTAIKLAALAYVFKLYKDRQSLPENLVLLIHSAHMYLEAELIIFISAILARAISGFELEPQFNEPYLSTSLREFWGRRWNLMIPNLLHLTVYHPIRSVIAPVVGRKYAALIAVLSSFFVSGLFHELLFYYWTHVLPTGEVTLYFMLHGVCTMLETAVQKMGGSKWRLHGVISGLLTIAFIGATSSWLFFPTLVRHGVVDRVINENKMLVSFLSTNIHKLSQMVF